MHDFTLYDRAFTHPSLCRPFSEFANRFKRLNLDIFITLIMGISSYLAKPTDALYGTTMYDRAFIQKEGLQKRL